MTLDDDHTDGGYPAFSQEQRTAMEVRLIDQDRTLAAAHQLEEALGSPSPRREAAWRAAVSSALEVLGAAAREEEQNARDPLSLLSDVARSRPRFRHRVHGVRAQYRRVRETIESLQAELAEEATDVDAADVRQRLAWLLVALRHQRARESDLIYEAYFDTFEGDAGDQDF